MGVAVGKVGEREKVGEGLSVGLGSAGASVGVMGIGVGFGSEQASMTRTRTVPARIVWNLFEILIVYSFQKHIGRLNRTFLDINITAKDQELLSVFPLARGN